MQDYTEDIDISFLGTGGDFSFRHVVTQDNVPSMSEAYFRRNHDPHNWSDNREMRKVGAVPALALHNARLEGWNLNDQKELRRWLELHPEFMTVRGINTGKPGGIIVK